MATHHGLRIEAVVDPTHGPRLVDPNRVEALLIALAEEAGPGQTAYDPQIAAVTAPEAGVSATCLFPGGSVVLHAYEAEGRLPPRFTLDVTASDPIEVASLMFIVERRLGVLDPSAVRTASRLSPGA